VGVGNGGNEGGEPREGWLGRRAFVTASLSLLIARHEGSVGGSRGVVVGGERGRASDATHSRVAVAGQALGAAAVQSSAGRPAVRMRLLVILPSLASMLRAWSSWVVVGLRCSRSRSWVRVSPPGSW